MQIKADRLTKVITATTVSIVIILITILVVVVVVVQVFDQSRFNNVSTEVSFGKENVTFKASATDNVKK